VQLGATHVPPTEPGGFVHVPAQQSACVVQEPLIGEHFAPHVSLPVASGTHGSPQQSALDAHAVPGAGWVAQLPTKWMRHRGMWSSSRPQHSSGWLLQLPDGVPTVSQQSFDTLHESVPPTLQVWPGSLQAPPLLPHRPNSSVDLFFTHVVGLPPFGPGAPDQPQQSLSTRQISAIGWQPDGC
jgi:hypothetical protein